MKMNGPSWIDAVPGFRRLMVFADGENLVARFQDMLRAGHVPRENDVTHIQDVLVWGEWFTSGLPLVEIIRATYYTYVVGDDAKVQATREQIKKITFVRQQNSQIPNTL